LRKSNGGRNQYFKVTYLKGFIKVDALFSAFLIASTAILSVGLGVWGAHVALNAILYSFAPGRFSRIASSLSPQQSHASGD
jgi:hypothetical protein